MPVDSIDADCSACAFDQTHSSCVESYQPVCCTIHLGEFFSSFALQTLQSVKTHSSALFTEIQTQVSRRNISAIRPLAYSSCRQAERIFNIIACIPAFGIISGTVRVFAGQLQVIAGIALGAASECHLFMTKTSAKNDSLKEKWESLVDLGKEMTIHGCLNIIRGMGETFVSTYTFGLGNLILIIPNIIDNRNFESRIRYGSISFTPNPQLEVIKEALPYKT